jgi:hypothetical protein
VLLTGTGQMGKMPIPQEFLMNRTQLFIWLAEVDVEIILSQTSDRVFMTTFVPASRMRRCTIFVESTITR